MCRSNLQPFALLCPPALPTQEVPWGMAKTFASWVRLLLCLLNHYRLNHYLLSHWAKPKSPLPLNTAARAAAPDQKADHQKRLVPECPENYEWR